MYRSDSCIRLADEHAQIHRELEKRKKGEEDKMKYILMMSGTKADFNTFASWPKEALKAHVQFMRAFNQELRNEGTFVDAEGLAFPHEAKIVRAGANGEVVTDGIFPETKEFLAGYWIVDVETTEQAYSIAARASMAPAPEGAFEGHIPIEVRQIMSEMPEELLQ
jgi:hypothetical protein